MPDVTQETHDRQQESGAAAIGPATGSGEIDPFLTLHKMSTTAGLGSGDYVAINGCAIAALILGIASSIVLFGSLLLLLIPGAGIVCGILAFRQISNSNGTQTGRGLAGMGLLLALGFGGGYVGHLAIQNIRDRTEQNQVIWLIQEFGHFVSNSKYEDAYNLADEHFKSQVPEQEFADRWKGANSSAFRGAITGMDWNGLLKFDDDPVTGQRQGGGMILISFAKLPEWKERQGMAFRKIDGVWRIEGLPDLFPPQGPQQRQNQAGNVAPVVPRGPAGPPAPAKN